MVALGVRGALKSDAAMRAATTKTTVVKKPKTFWTRVRELYILGYCVAAVIVYFPAGSVSWKERDVFTATSLLNGFGEATLTLAYADGGELQGRCAVAFSGHLAAWTHWLNLHDMFT